MVANITVHFSWWVRALFSTIRLAPWAFRWIGEDRIAAFVVKHGFRVVAK